MQKDYYAEWLKNWFTKRVGMPHDAANRDFFVEGWLDSLKTLELISEIETVLKIPLDDSTFSDPRFFTITGLAEILSELENVKRPR